MNTDRPLALRSSFARLPGCGLMFILFASATGLLAQDWYWTGTSSSSWSDLSNWNSEADATGNVPTDVSQLQNSDLLLTTQPFMPTNQDIPALAIKKLHFDSDLTTFTIDGQPLQFTTINIISNPDSLQIVTFKNHLILNSSSGWSPGNSNFRVRIEGGMSETGGSRSFAANLHGIIEFRSPVTTTGGWRNNQATASFFGIETLGTFPTELMEEYFYTGYGSMRFNSPDGAAYTYKVPAAVGGRSSNSLNFNIMENVVVDFYGPISETTDGRGFTKAGAGALIVRGGMNISGKIGVDAGMLNLGAAIALATLESAYFGISAGSLDLNGHEVSGYRLVFNNSSGVEGSGGIRNSNRSKTAVLDCNLTQIGTAGNVVQFGGPGDIVLNGDITPATSSHRIFKTGAGSLTFAGSSAYEGPWATSGGTLILDYRVDNSEKIADSADLSVSRNLTLLGNASADTVEKVGALKTGYGNVETTSSSSRITVTAAGSQSATLLADTISHDSSSTVDFAPGPNAAIKVLTPNTGKNIALLAGLNTWHGSSFARAANLPDDAGYYAIEPLPDGEYATAFVSGSYEIVDLPAASTLSSSETAAAIRFNNPAGGSLTLNANLMLRGDTDYDNGYKGAILVTPNLGENTAEINGTGILCPGGQNGYLHVHQYNTAAPLIISTVINSYSAGTGLTKSGPGELILTNEDNFFSYLQLYEGTLTLSAMGNANNKTPGGYGSSISLNSATLKYTGDGDTSDRKITLRGNGSIDASGSGPLVLTAETFLTPGSGRDHELTLTGSGDAIIQGTIDLPLGTLVKQGSGNWTLEGHNSLWGGARIEEGTLTVNATLGRNVSVTANGQIAGNGSIAHDLTLGGTLVVDLDQGGLTIGGDILLDNANLILSGNAGEEPIVALSSVGTISGEFSSVNEGYVVTLTATEVLITAAPPAETVIIIR